VWSIGLFVWLRYVGRYIGLHCSVSGSSFFSSHEATVEAAMLDALCTCQCSENIITLDLIEIKKNHVQSGVEYHEVEWGCRFITELCVNGPDQQSHALRVPSWELCWTHSYSVGKVFGGALPTQKGHKQVA